MIQYIGFEPSGKPHIEVIHILRSMPKMRTIFFIARWHAILNGKTIYEGFREELEKLATKLNIDYVVCETDNNYLYQVANIELEVSKHLTTARVQKGLMATGKESKGSERFSILRYITMQVTDPFLLDVDHIVSGIDQRKCSILSVEVAKKLEFRHKPLTFETHPLLLNTRAKNDKDVNMYFYY